MTDKCRKAKGAALELCDMAKAAVRTSFVSLQTLRYVDNGKTRQRLALRRGKESVPFHFCPWCRASIDTRSIERAAQGESKGGAHHG